MGRHKTISDDDVLAAARSLFRERGHTVSTREIAKIAGVSETVLYQRFGSKDALFFAAMVPSAPDLRQMLGPLDVPGDARTYVRSVVERMAGYFAEMLPLGIQVMTHPSFDTTTFDHAQPASAAVRLEEELAMRLRRLQQRGRIATTSVRVAARLLTSLAHDWALRNVLAGKTGPADRRQLVAIVDVVWRGLAPR